MFLLQGQHLFTDTLIIFHSFNFVFFSLGSIAGSVSLVTGSIGRTMALLSFDENYQMVNDNKIIYVQQPQ